MAPRPPRKRPTGATAADTRAPAERATPDPTASGAETPASGSARPGAAAEGTGRDALLQNAVEEAARLLKADGGMIYLVDDEGVLRFAFDAGITDHRDRRWVRSLTLPVGVGMFGSAFAEQTTTVTGDYSADHSFPHSAAADRLVREVGMRSLAVAPLVYGGQAFGALGTFSKQPHAFDEADVGLVRALADHAAAGLANRALIERLAGSESELERRAEAERSLREIANRITAIHDQGDILQHVVEEAARLVRGSGAILALLDETGTELQWGYDDGLRQKFSPAYVAGLTLAVGVGVTGRALLERRVVIANEDLVNEFPRSPESDHFFAVSGFRSMIAGPIVGGSGPLGALEVYSIHEHAFAEADGDLIRALADQAAIAITNARRIEELGRSREEVARRAEAERALREIAARITAIRDPAEVLQRAVDEAARLLNADGARIDLVDEGTRALNWAFDAETGRQPGLGPITGTGEAEEGEGISGLAVAERRAFYTGDYLNDTRFRHAPSPDAFVERHRIRSALAAPLLAEGAAFGTLTVYSSRGDAFDDADAALIEALAHQAAVAITNARLIEQLARSEREISARADSERALREIAARITALRDPDEVLERIVEESKRLLGSDGGHLCLMSEDGTVLRPVMVAGGMDEEVADWLRTLEFPLNGGMNGLAAGLGRPVWTSDYRLDPRIPHGPDDEGAARRLSLVAMAVAPLRGPDGGVIGTLAISYAEPRRFETDEIELLQGLADQAAIAMTNSHLLERLASSEARYRHLVKASPDIVWAVDTEGVMTFMSDRLETLTGWSPDEVVGQHFGFLTTDTTMPQSIATWEAARSDPTGVFALEILMPVKGGGEPIPFEVWVTGSIRDGVFAGAHGSMRDLRERRRLERELRESEERYRHLVQNSPDLVWSIDAEARFTFLSDTCERLTGWRPGELLGRHFGAIVHPSTGDVARTDWAADLDSPSQELRGRLHLLHRDGHAVPAEFIAMTSLDASGLFAGANGSVRDMTERDRLERELRQSEERFRFLVENSPDVVFSTDSRGTFTFLSDTIQRITGFSASELVGEHFSVSVTEGSLPEAEARWAALVAHPATDQVVQVRLRRRDGSTVPVEISAIGMTAPDGTFGGIHGSTRDVSERERLERDLLGHATALAASEERAHLARELHDSVTQALFSMTLITRSIELLLVRDPAAAAERLGSLRDLQRDALAEMRALIFELRPGGVEQDGLVKALRTHTAALEGRIGLPIVLESDELERLPLDIEEALYRIAQESLHNIVKHAAAGKVRVRIERTATGVRLNVEDDGVGFDPSQIPPGHLGVAGMRSRADRIGARLIVESRPGSGTRIEVQAPVSAMPASHGPDGNGAGPGPGSGLDGEAPGGRAAAQPATAE